MSDIDIDIYEELAKSVDAKTALGNAYKYPNRKSPMQPYIDKCISMGGEKVACYGKENGPFTYIVGKRVFEYVEPEDYYSADMDSYDDDDDDDEGPALYIFFEKTEGKPVMGFFMKDNDKVYYNKETHHLLSVRGLFQKNLRLDKETFLKNGFKQGLTYKGLCRELGNLWQSLPDEGGDADGEKKP